MQKDPNAVDKARKAERKADEKSGLISIKPVKLEMGGAKASAFKKGGFKSAFGGDDVKKEDEAPPKVGGSKSVKVPEVTAMVETEVVESDTDDEYEYYDPRKPTECWEGCRGQMLSTTAS